MPQTRKTLLEQYYYLNPSFELRQKLGLAELPGLGGWYQDDFSMKEDGIDPSEIEHGIKPNGQFIPYWTDNESTYVDHEL